MTWHRYGKAVATISLQIPATADRPALLRAAVIGGPTPDAAMIRRMLLS
jgi:hypothetical protein